MEFYRNFKIRKKQEPPHRGAVRNITDIIDVQQKLSRPPKRMGALRVPSLVVERFRIEEDVSGDVYNAFRVMNHNRKEYPPEWRKYNGSLFEVISSSSHSKGDLVWAKYHNTDGKWYVLRFESQGSDSLGGDGLACSELFTETKIEQNGRCWDFYSRNVDIELNNQCLKDSASEWELVASIADCLCCDEGSVEPGSESESESVPPVPCTCCWQLIPFEEGQCDKSEVPDFVLDIGLIGMTSSNDPFCNGETTVVSLTFFNNTGEDAGNGVGGTEEMRIDLTSNVPDPSSRPTCLSASDGGSIFDNFAENGFSVSWLIPESWPNGTALTRSFEMLNNGCVPGVSQIYTQIFAFRGYICSPVWQAVECPGPGPDPGPGP